MLPKGSRRQRGLGGKNMNEHRYSGGKGDRSLQRWYNRRRKRIGSFSLQPTQKVLCVMKLKKKKTFGKLLELPLKASMIHMVYDKICWSRYLVALTCSTHTLPSANPQTPLDRFFSLLLFPSISKPFLWSQRTWIIHYTHHWVSKYTFKSKTA